VSFLAAALGAVASGAVAALAADWYRVSSFEGGSGYMVVGLGLLGGMAGFPIGLVVSRVVAGRPKPGFLKALAFAAGIILGVAAPTPRWSPTSPGASTRGSPPASTTSGSAADPRASWRRVSGARRGGPALSPPIARRLVPPSRRLAPRPRLSTSSNCASGSRTHAHGTPSLA